MDVFLDLIKCAFCLEWLGLSRVFPISVATLVFFSNYVKNVTRILVRFALNLCILFGRIVTSIIFILLIQEHERPSCSLLSSSISLQRVPSLP